MATLGELLRVFPRDHIAYARRLAPGRHVQLAAKVARVRANIIRRGRMMGFFELDAAVDCAALRLAAAGDEEEEEDGEADDEGGYWDPLDAEADAGEEAGAGAADALDAGEGMEPHADTGAEGPGGESEAGVGQDGTGFDEDEGVEAEDEGGTDANGEEGGPSPEELALAPAAAFEGIQTVCGQACV